MLSEDIEKLHEYCASMRALEALHGEVAEEMTLMGEEATAEQMGKKIQALLQKKIERLQRHLDDPVDPVEDEDDEFVLSHQSRDCAEMGAFEEISEELRRDYGFGGDEVDMEREEAIEAIKGKISTIFYQHHEAGYYIDKRFDELLSMVPERERGAQDRKDARNMRAAQREFHSVRGL